MGVDVTRSELLNRASILTIAEIELFLTQENAASSR